MKKIIRNLRNINYTYKESKIKNLIKMKNKQMKRRKKTKKRKKAKKTKKRKNLNYQK